MLGPITRQTEAAGLRYTDVSVEGAPPFVALGTAIGALRGLIVDILWIKVNFMKEKGLFYEVMADADPSDATNKARYATIGSSPSR